MSAAPDLSARPPAPAAEPTRRQLVEENDALKARVASLEDEIKALRTERDAAKSAAAAVGAEDAWVLKTRLRHDGRDHVPGDVMPFDPTKPPKGSGGLIEGVHYERARIVVRA